MIAAALAFLVAYSIQVIADLPDEQGVWADAVVWAAWAVFAADYGVRLWLAPKRGRWFVRNLHELAILALRATCSVPVRSRLPCRRSASGYGTGTSARKETLIACRWA